MHAILWHTCDVIIQIAECFHRGVARICKSMIITVYIHAKRHAVPAFKLLRLIGCSALIVIMLIRKQMYTHIIHVYKAERFIFYTAQQ